MGIRIVYTSDVCDKNKWGNSGKIKVFFIVPGTYKHFKNVWKYQIIKKKLILPYAGCQSILWKPVQAKLQKRGS